MLLIDGVFTGSYNFFSAVFRLTILMSKFLSQVVTLGWAFVIRVRNSTETLDFNCY